MKKGGNMTSLSSKVPDCAERQIFGNITNLKKLSDNDPVNNDLNVEKLKIKSVDDKYLLRNGKFKDQENIDKCATTDKISEHMCTCKYLEKPSLSYLKNKELNQKAIDEISSDIYLNCNSCSRSNSNVDYFLNIFQMNDSIWNTLKTNKNNGKKKFRMDKNEFEKINFSDQKQSRIPRLKAGIQSHKVKLLHYKITNFYIEFQSTSC